MGKYERYWEMTSGGPYDAGENEIFKCKDCGAETHPENGWNGEPNPRNCHGACKSRATDWSPGKVSLAYRRNYDRIFSGNRNAVA